MMLVNRTPVSKCGKYLLLHVMNLETKIEQLTKATKTTRFVTIEINKKMLKLQKETRRIEVAKILHSVIRTSLINIDKGLKYQAIQIRLLHITIQNLKNLKELNPHMSSQIISYIIANQNLTKATLKMGSAIKAYQQLTAHLIRKVKKKLYLRTLF